MVSKISIRILPYRKQVASAELLTCPEFSSPFCRLSRVSRDCFEVLGADDIWYVEIVRIYA
jgi:hypothetical protein